MIAPANASGHLPFTAARSVTVHDHGRANALQECACYQQHLGGRSARFPFALRLCLVAEVSHPRVVCGL